MSSSSSSLATGDVSRPRDPYQSPSYPKRHHYQERASLESSLRGMEERLREAATKLSVLGGDPRRAEFTRLYYQLAGARDQVADCARRMPLEVGALYHEDHERLIQAQQAFERVWAVFSGKNP